MTPLIAFIIAELVKQAPGLAIDLIKLFSKETITDEDWAALKLQWDKPASSFYKTPPQ
jgi:hypothetical protein